MAYETCENCGGRIYKYGCVNCNEEDYIAEQNDENGSNRHELQVSQPSEPTFGQWIDGEPEQACWCIAKSRTMDKEESYRVDELWFNPMSLDKWYYGKKTELKEAWGYKVVAYMPLPKP